MAYKRTRKDFETELQNQETPFVVYGTPLPPLDDHTRDDGSYVPVWKQEVTDDRGRKRLHGAFTGGFSAGYFNTVGSKEGWTPSTFISSRTNRAKDAHNVVNQRPEDFMDEEDVREQEESQQLSTDRGFGGFGTADDTNHRDALMDLLRPAEATIGDKLLNRMGWKTGQGIGPKVKRHIDPSDDTSEMHLFAPDDTQMLPLTKKSDHRGLGFDKNKNLDTGASRATRPNPKHTSAESDTEDEGRPGLSFAMRNKKPTKLKQGGFGVGILNDTGSDDEDAYSIGPRILYQKTLGGDKKSKKIATSGNIANPLLKNKPVFVSKRLSTIGNALRKCHDGRLPLDGFVLADNLDILSTLSLNEKEYKPPIVPEKWEPSRASSKEMVTDQSTYEPTAEAAKSSTLNSFSRGKLLGESALPGKSVFDYLTPATREKLMKASGKSNLPPALGEPLPGTSAAPLSRTDDIQIPQIEPRIALQALSRTLNGGFTPYASDPAKAIRYKTYLESQADSSTSTAKSPVRPPNTSVADHLTELHEFARAAEVFKPVSGLMASRFTTSSATATVESSTPTNPDLDTLLSKPATKPRSPAEEAARMGMFGHLTRSVENFYPTRLVCKRFGVEMPVNADMPRDDTRTAAMPMDVDVDVNTDLPEPFDAQGRSASGEHRHGENDGGSGLGSTSIGSQQLSIEGADGKGVSIQVNSSSQPTTHVVVDPEWNDALEREKPGAAVFKAIFGSDDEDEDE